MSIWISIMSVLSLNYAVVSEDDFCYSSGGYNYYCESPESCCGWGNYLCCSNTSSSDADKLFGIVFGSAVGAIIILLIVVFCCKKWYIKDRVVHPLGTRRETQNDQDDLYTVERVQTVNESMYQLTYHPSSQA